MTRPALPGFLLLAFFVALCAPACSNAPPSPSPPNQSGSGGAELITGRERLGWDQQAPDADELRSYTYVLYVDDVAAPLPNATCGALAGEGPTAACTSPLPALQIGQHRLELATRITRSGTVLESARSVPILVTVTVATSALSTALPAQPKDKPDPDSARYRVEMVATGLDKPTALAQLPDGRLLIAERGGRVRIADSGRLLDTPALVLADAEPGAEGWSLALDPDFQATRYVYVSYAARDTEGTRIGRVIRYREVGGTLAEAAVILDNLPAQIRAPRTRIGPDGALYVGTTARYPRDADNLGSDAGKVLRFSRDGLTPLDNPIRFSPVFSFGHRGRLDFDWEPATRELWHVETDPGGVLLGRPDSRRRGERQTYIEGIQATGIAFHAGSTPAAWRNDLFLASPEAECLYRITGLLSTPPKPEVERLLANAYGRIEAVLSAADGLYFATANGAVDDRGRPADAVFRISDRGFRAVLAAGRQH